MCGREFLLRQASAYPLKRKKFGRYFIMFTAGQEDDMKASLGHFIFKKKLGRSSTNVVLIGKLLNCFRSFGWG